MAAVWARARAELRSGWRRGIGLALLIGVIAGTYSTVTIVPAVAIAWNNLTGRKHDIAGPAARPKAETREETKPEQRKRKAG